MIDSGSNSVYYFASNLCVTTKRKRPRQKFLDDDDEEEDNVKSSKSSPRSIRKSGWFWKVTLVWIVTSTRRTSSPLLVSGFVHRPSCHDDNHHRSLFPLVAASSGGKTPGQGGKWNQMRLWMVLTTPESIIEQASTQKLLDDLIDESTRTSARRPIMMQFDPRSGWIWKRWKGTIFSETWDSCISKMLYAIILLVLFQAAPPVVKGHLERQLQGFHILWGQMLQVTTFTLTFFLNQAYALWRKCYSLSRRLQGRLQDINMSLAAHATRKPRSPGKASGGSSSSSIPTSSTSSSSTTASSTFTAASRQTLELISRYARLFNLLTYASFTRSHRPILTPRGMRRLVERGLMTQQEREVLVNAELPATQRHNAVLLWIARTFLEAREAGHFIGHAGFENQILEKIHVCRAQYGAFGDELAGRMPLAYAHIVQVLVDVVLCMYPLMAISTNMSPTLAVLGTGILTVSYQGLFDLAKQFLDPYDNESFGKGEDPLVVDTLIAETNAGSVRWMNSLAEFPLSQQKIKDGELSEYLLPVRGYSVEELERMELERLQRERELQERRLAEEDERRLEQERTRKLQRAAKAMVPCLYDPAEYNLDVLEKEFVPHWVVLAPPSAKTPTNGDYMDISTSQGPISTVSEDEYWEHHLPTLFQAPLFLGQSVVTPIINHLDEIVGGVPPGLIPPNTAAAKQERPKKTLTSPFSATASEKGTPQTLSTVIPPVVNINPGALVGGGADAEKHVDDFRPGQHEDKNESDEGDYEVEEEEVDVEENTEEYEHVFDLESNPNTSGGIGLMWFEEFDEDGEEIRLSQVMADEVWEEELATQREKEIEANAIRTFEQYTKRIEEIRNATNAELAETQEILSARPGAEPLELRRPPAGDNGKNKPLHYDQTKLDGISQLWGLPPGEISDAFGYEPPSLDPGYEASFDGLRQLSGESRSTGSSSSSRDFEMKTNYFDEEVNEDYYYGDDDEDDFSGLGTLWGESDVIGDLKSKSGDRYSSVRPMNVPSDIYNKPSKTTIPSSPRDYPVRWKNSNGGGVRMSQILADEVWPEELPTETEPILNPVTFEDYKKQIAEILEAEKEEMVETEAILNAPAFAESLAGFDDNKSVKLKAMNETKKSTDDLAILEMDIPEIVTEEKSSNLDQDLLRSFLANKNATATDQAEMLNIQPNSKDNIVGLENSDNVPSSSVSETGDKFPPLLDASLLSDGSSSNSSSNLPPDWNTNRE